MEPSEEDLHKAAFSEDSMERRVKHFGITHGAMHSGDLNFRDCIN